MICFTDDLPTLMKFISFPMASGKVNLAEKIGNSYAEFGVMLLEDEDESRTIAIVKEERGSASNINRHIFRLWLQGKGRQPVTWATLVSVLQDIGLDTLASNIDKCLN